MTDHGTPLNAALGSHNVRIAGQAAWRTVTDFHTCPQSDGTKPHLGGVVAVGSTKVFINGFAAARQGDAITEAGRPNTITITGGVAKVQIG